jgi:hypothetical protein
VSADSAALEALESRARTQVAGYLDAVTANVGAYLAQVVGKATGTGSELLSQQGVHQTLVSVLASAQGQVETVTRAGYVAAAQLGAVAAGRDLAALGHDVPDLGDLGGYLDSVLADVRTAFGAALFDIQTSVQAAFDGVQGDAAPAGRVLTTNTALGRAVARLRVRASATTVTALHRGFSDAQLAAHADYRSVNPFIPLSKRWQVTAADPCPACAALHGQTVPLSEEFDHRAGATAHYRPPRVYRDLHAPPRHPNCRCRLILVAGKPE